MSEQKTIPPISVIRSQPNAAPEKPSVKVIADTVRSLGFPVDEQVREIILFMTELEDSQGNRIVGAVNSEKQLALFTPLNTRTETGKAQRALVHELSHQVSPFSPLTPNLYRTRELRAEAQNMLKLLAVQSMITGVYFDDYHKLLAEQFKKREITFEKLADETFTILVENLFLNQVGLLEQSIKQKTSLSQQGLKGVAPIETTATIISLLNGMPDSVDGVINLVFKSKIAMTKSADQFTAQVSGREPIDYPN